MKLEAQSAALRRLAARLVDDPDDLVQDAWVDALRNPPQESGPQGPWLRAVLRNRGITNRRADARRRARERSVAAPEPLPSAEQIQVARELLEHLATLPAADRDLLTWRYWEGHTLDACAERLGISASAARSKHARALAKLRDRLDARAGGRAAWLAALVPWLRPSTSSVFRAASLSVGGVLAGGVLVMLAALDPACGTDSGASSTPEEPHPAVAAAPMRESASRPTSSASPSVSVTPSIDFDAEKHPCERPIAAADSPTMAAVLASGKPPTGDELVTAMLECQRLHGPAEAYRAAREADDGSVHPLLSGTMAMGHIWPAMRHCHIDDDGARARVSFDIRLDADGEMRVEHARMLESDGLDADEEACVVSSIYVAEVGLRRGDPTAMGLEPGTRLRLPRLVEVEFRESRADVVGSGVRPAGRLTVDDGFDDGLATCGPGPIDVELHWDPETGALLDTSVDDAWDSERRACVIELVRAKVQPLRSRFFPRRDADTYQQCTLEAGSKPRCESEPLYEVVAD